MSEPDHPASRLPLVEEQLHVTKRAVETDRVRIRTVVEHAPVVFDEIIDRGAVEVLRVPVERAVSAPPAPRQEGDTLVISIVEERPVIVTRLFVVEELHVRRTVTQETVSLTATTRKMRAVVEHPQAEGTTDDRSQAI